MGRAATVVYKRLATKERATLLRAHGLAQMPLIVLFAEISGDVPQRLQIKAQSRTKNFITSSSP